MNTMDMGSVIETLRGTLVPETREASERALEGLQKIIGFSPSLLQVVMTADLDMAVRQAGVIYFKNLVTGYWVPKEDKKNADIPDHLKPSHTNFSLHEQDRAMIRDNLVDAITAAPDAVRIQLLVCARVIIRHDFPGTWTGLVDKIALQFQSGDAHATQGSLLILYQLVKVYEYKKKEDRTHLDEVMTYLLPQLVEIFRKCATDESSNAALVRKTVIKNFYAFTQYLLPTKVLTQEVTTQWMELLNATITRAVPESTLQIDEDERPQLPCWKEKKWAMHVVTRFFDRYGSPSNVSAEYNDFASWFLKTFAVGILNSVLTVLAGYGAKADGSKKYVSPRVLQQCLNYVNTAVAHAVTWKVMKDHMNAMLENVVLPIMSFNEDDQDLWETDPYEYVRVKFDIFEDFVSPSTAAQTLLHTVCSKRKAVLDPIMQVLMKILLSPECPPAQKDGALHMIGTLADILVKRKTYKDQMENFLSNQVYPQFASTVGYLRARACWMLHYFSDIKFKNVEVLKAAFDHTVRCLINPNEEIPVRVESAIALQMLLSNQEAVGRDLVRTNITHIVKELLEIIRGTENDDLTTVMQKIVVTYTEELMPLAIEMINHLVETFAKILESGDGGDEKAITAMGILNTIETILSVMGEKPEVRGQLEQAVLRAIVLVLTGSHMEFYEEAFSLICDLTTTAISPAMWEAFQGMVTVFGADGQDYFTDMMPALHNYVTVDTAAFLANEAQPEAMYKMCRHIMLEYDAGEDPECHAAKLLEVMILQCREKVNHMIPAFLETVFVRLAKEVKTSELRTMCLQVAIAALIHDNTVFYSAIESRVAPTLNQDPVAVLKNFVGLWINDSDCFIGIHDRKISVLGLCRLISGGSGHPAWQEYVPQIMPSLIMLFRGLKTAYEVRKEAEGEEEESSDEDDDGDDSDLEDGEALDTDEDDIDEDSAMYLESLQEKINKHSNGTVTASLENDDDEESDDDSDDCDIYDETSLENYTTPIDDEDTGVDEYQIFEETFKGLQASNLEWYNQLTSAMSPDQQKAVQEIVLLANQRKAARQSKSIEMSGGYQFNQATVPSQFNFGGGNPTSPFGNK